MYCAVIALCYQVAGVGCAARRGGECRRGQEEGVVWMPLSPAGGLSEGAPGKQAGRRGWWFTRWVRRRGGLLAGVRGFSPAGDARAGPTQMRRRPAEGADVEEGVIAE